MKKVRLVLGSGGARGVAHIAVIEELEKKGFEIIEVIGCSMGAVVGGMYASGHLQDYKKWLFTLTKKGVFDLLDFTFAGQGFVKGEKLFARHLEVAGAINIEDFKIPFTAVAADMLSGEEVHFKSGDLYKALRASVSIPGVFVPVLHDKKVLVDGGVLNPLPLDLAIRDEESIIVAVDLNAKESASFNKKRKESKQNSELRTWFENLLPDSFIEKAKAANNQEELKSFSLFEMMNNTYSLTQDKLTKLMLEKYPPDVLINIPRNVSDTFEFYRAKEVYESGVRAFDKAFEQVQV